LSNTIEMTDLVGTVEYIYHRLRPDNSTGDEPSVYFENFHNLSELLTLTSEQKMAEIKKRFQADWIEVDAICLNTQSSEDGTKVEILLMKTENYGEVIPPLRKERFFEKCS